MNAIDHAAAAAMFVTTATCLFLCLILSCLAHHLPAAWQC